LHRRVPSAALNYPGRIGDAPLAQALRQLRYPGSFARVSAALSVELPGIEPACLPGNLPSERLFSSVSFRFSPSRYLRFLSRVLTASRVIAPFPIRSVQHA
jgi:hypothetical protein